ncbi:MAG TPA: hypothetical protein ENG63_09275 [Candidatus Desulfofervidus auxilii]|uniref:Uncharacterized protein n=1 Tax=Desulfofervidus auxilii TaxID=1621989 RepID=A0A7C0YAL2_DESA2|nr:hypothetical protein [Candidatus Desulfofervidus auxilii]
MAGYTESRYFEPVDEETAKEVIDECKRRNWCDKISPATNAEIIQTVLDKNKPKSCRVLGISSSGDHTTKIFVRCDETVLDEEMCNWMIKSADEVKKKSKLGSIKNFSIFIVDKVRRLCR